MRSGMRTERNVICPFLKLFLTLALYLRHIFSRFRELRYRLEACKSIENIPNWSTATMQRKRRAPFLSMFFAR
uniref:Uncharacterized protein n=1 Tax=Glossina morsitans morsitans TaxID=37546 RepID=A0A1B0GFT5_GLOMM